MADDRGATSCTWLSYARYMDSSSSGLMADDCSRAISHVRVMKKI